MIIKLSQLGVKPRPQWSTNLWLSCVFSLISHFIVEGQDQKVADSLKLELERELPDSIKLEVLRNVTFNENNLQLAIQYSDRLISLAKASQNHKYIFYGFLQKGYKTWSLGDLDLALDYFITSITHAKRAKFLKGEGTALSAMASIYTTSNSHKNAISYFQKAIAILSKTDDLVALAGTIMNAGDAYLSHGDYDSALIYFEKSGNLYDQLNYGVGKAYNLGNIGMVHANLSNNPLAEQNINQAITILEELGDFYPICFYLLAMADIFQEKGDIQEAKAYAEKSLDLAITYKLKQQISDANLKLSELYEADGNVDESLQHYKNYIAYRDSVTNLETIQKMADQRTKFEVSLRESEIAALEKDRALQRTYFVIAGILFFLSLVVVLYFRQRWHNVRLLVKADQKEHDNKIKDLLKTQETQALQAMVQGKEDERKHLAKELHNHLGSLLATVKVNLNGLETPDKSKYRTIVGLVNQATQDVRNISHELNMGVSEGFGLIPALQELVNHLKQANKLNVVLSASLGVVQIDSQSEILIYRIVQELVSNVLKHAKATKLSISLTGFEEDNVVNILVEDNGKGFDLANVDNDSKGIGLDSLRDMIRKLDGEMSIDSGPKGGTTISIDLSFSIPETAIES